MRTSAPTRTNAAHLLCLLVVLAISPGCRSTPPTDNLSGKHELRVLAPVVEAEQHKEELRFLRQLERLAADPTLAPSINTFHQAEEARHRNDPVSVKLYADVALACWPLLSSSKQVITEAGEMSAMEEATGVAMDPAIAAWKMYHHSLARMTQQADRLGLLDPQRGIRLIDANGNEEFIEIARNGFPWLMEDFNQLHVVETPLKAHLKRYWSDQGLGIPMVAIRQRQESTPHMGNVVPYSATAVLRPAPDYGRGVQLDAASDEDVTTVRQASHASRSKIAVLELHDPLRVAQLTDSNRRWDLARDLSAPLGFAQSHLNRDNLKSFLNPGRNDEYSGLRMLEPYQPGKIPIVFVHGLLSDRLTWLDLINDLRHSPQVSQHYQIWLYQYPTGQPFIISAAEMRNTLSQTLQQLDPEESDASLREMVLVGHSMGGLVSKLLITRSNNELWDSIANKPMAEVEIAQDKRQRIESIFVFEPLPFVKRVVFIGSPHQGSRIATSWIGVLGSALVHGQKDRAQATKTILHDNPGVFKDLERHLPTSVDMLRPDNPVLMATYRLPVNPSVRLHTLIGTGHPLRDGTDADGVVPVESAQHPGTTSEKRLEASHTSLPDHPETTRELMRILDEHRNL